MSGDKKDRKPVKPNAPKEGTVVPTVQCPLCHGKKRVAGLRCALCKGLGRIRK